MTHSLCSKRRLLIVQVRQRTRVCIERNFARPRISDGLLHPVREADTIFRYYARRPLSLLVPRRESLESTVRAREPPTHNGHLHTADKRTHSARRVAKRHRKNTRSAARESAADRRTKIARVSHTEWSEINYNKSTSGDLTETRSEQTERNRKLTVGGRIVRLIPGELSGIRRWDTQ